MLTYAGASKDTIISHYACGARQGDVTPMLLLCGGMLANARPAALIALAFYALVLADAQPIALLSLKKKRQSPHLLDPSHCMAFFCILHGVFANRVVF